MFGVLASSASCSASNKGHSSSNNANSHQHQRTNVEPNHNKNVQEKMTKYRKYSSESLINALAAIRERHWSLRRASRQFGIPLTTLSDKINGRVPDQATSGPNPILSEEEEGTLAAWAAQMSKIGYGRTRQELLDAVKKALDKRGAVSLFKDNRPGKDWFYAFLRRHPELTVKTPEQLSQERAMFCRPQALNAWFDDYIKNLSEIEGGKELIHDPTRIWNTDESGFSLCSKVEKVVAVRGCRSLYQISSGDKTQITILACVNGAGNHIPPMEIFPGQRFKYNPLDGAVPGTYFGSSENGWIDTALFYGWLSNHFIKHIPPQRPVLLLVDGHSSHIDPEISSFCNDNKIVLYCLPPHSSHVMQPLDVSFYGPLKSNWRKATREFGIESPGQQVTKQTFSKVFRKAWELTLNAHTIIEGFRKAGLCPLDRKAVDVARLQPSVLWNDEGDSNVKEQDKENVGENKAPVTLSSSETDVVVSSSKLTNITATLNSVVNRPVCSGDTATSVSESASKSHLCTSSSSSSLSQSLLAQSHLCQSVEPQQSASNCKLFSGVLTYPCFGPRFKKDDKKKTKADLPYRHLSCDQMISYFKNKENDKVMEEMKEKKRVEREIKRKEMIERKNAPKKQKVNESKCSKCCKTFKKSENPKLIGCESCPRWYHIGCTDLTDLDENDDLESLAFTCEFCTS